MCAEPPLLCGAELACGTALARGALGAAKLRAMFCDAGPGDSARLEARGAAKLCDGPARL